MDRSLNTGAIHGSTSCFHWSATRFFGWAQNVDLWEAVTSPWRLFTFLEMDVEQNFCIKYVPDAGNDRTWIQTEDGEYIYSRFLWLTANSIDRIVLLSLLVAILFWMECSSWNRVLHGHLEHSTGSVGSLHVAQFSYNRPLEWLNFIHIVQAWITLGLLSRSSIQKQPEGCIMLLFAMNSSIQIDFKVLGIMLAVVCAGVPSSANIKTSRVVFFLSYIPTLLIHLISNTCLAFLGSCLVFPSTFCNHWKFLYLGTLLVTLVIFQTLIYSNLG